MFLYLKKNLLIVMLMNCYWKKVYMSNARRFGFSVCEAGFDAKITKFDLVKAYKNVPVKLFDLRLQGFP